MTRTRDDRRDQLFDLAVANPDGITVNDMMSTYGWNLYQCNEAIHDLRTALGDSDSINFPCDPQGGGERWLYRLVGNLDDVRGWAMNRINDTDTRLRTQQ